MAKAALRVEEREITVDHPCEFFPTECREGEQRDWTREDDFFRQKEITSLWNFFIAQGRHRAAEKVWIEVLRVSGDWEKQNHGPRVFKGTPYYLWGVTRILGGDLEKGFLLLHLAYQEDKERHPNEEPVRSAAHVFITLTHDATTPPPFVERIEQVEKFLRDRIEEYQKTRGGTLTLDEFRSRFLACTDLQDVVFLFVFSAFRLLKWSTKMDKTLTRNAFASLLQADTLFAFCLVLDKVAETKNSANKGKHPSFAGNLAFLSNRTSLNLHRTVRRKKDVPEVSLASHAFGIAFDETLQSLLDSQYRFCHDPNIRAQPIEEDMMIALGLRNFGAHRIEDQPIIYQNFKEIAQRILNALFFAVENLYP